MAMVGPLLGFLTENFFIVEAFYSGFLFRFLDFVLGLFRFFL